MLLSNVKPSKEIEGLGDVQNGLSLATTMTEQLEIEKSGGSWNPFIQNPGEDGIDSRDHAQGFTLYWNGRSLLDMKELGLSQDASGMYYFNQARKVLGWDIPFGIGTTLANKAEQVFKVVYGDMASDKRFKVRYSHDLDRFFGDWEHDIPAMIGASHNIGYIIAAALYLVAPELSPNEFLFHTNAEWGAEDYRVMAPFCLNLFYQAVKAVYAKKGITYTFVEKSVTPEPAELQEAELSRESKEADTWVEYEAVDILSEFVSLLCSETLSDQRSTEIHCQICIPWSTTPGEPNAFWQQEMTTPFVYYDYVKYGNTGGYIPVSDIGVTYVNDFGVAISKKAHELNRNKVSFGKFRLTNWQKIKWNIMTDAAMAFVQKRTTVDVLYSAQGVPLRSDDLTKMPVAVRAEVRTKVFWRKSPNSGGAFFVRADSYATFVNMALNISVPGAWFKVENARVLSCTWLGTNDGTFNITNKPVNGVFDLSNIDLRINDPFIIEASSTAWATNNLKAKWNAQKLRNLTLTSDQQAQLLDKVVNNADMDVEFLKLVSHAQRQALLQNSITLRDHIIESVAGVSESPIEPGTLAAAPLDIDMTLIDTVVVDSYEGAPATTIGDLTAEINAIDDGSSTLTDEERTAKELQFAKLLSTIDANIASKYSMVACEELASTLDSAVLSEDGSVKSDADIGVTLETLSQSVLATIPNDDSNLANAIKQSTGQGIAALKEQTLSFANVMRTTSDKLSVASLSTFNFLSGLSASTVDKLKSYAQGFPGMFEPSVNGYQDLGAFTQITGVDAAMLSIKKDAGYITDKAGSVIQLIGTVAAKVATGALSKVRNFVSDTFGSGSDFKAYASGLSTLALPAVSVTLTDGEVFEKYAYIFTLLKETYRPVTHLLTQIGRNYISIMQVERKIVVRVMPIIVSDDYYIEGVPNDYLFYKGLAKSMSLSIDSTNSIINLVNSWNLPDCNLQLLTKETLAQLEILAFDNIAAASTFVLQTDVMMSVAAGALITTALLFIPVVGWAAALITGAITAAVGASIGVVDAVDSMINWEEKATTDAAYANELITIHDFIKIWTGAIPLEVATLTMQVLDISAANGLVHSGIGKVMESTTNLGYIPLLPVPIILKFKYEFVTDKQREDRSKRGIIITAIAVITILVMATVASLKRFRATNIAKLQAKQWSLNSSDPLYAVKQRKLAMKLNRMTGMSGIVLPSMSVGSDKTISDLLRRIG